MRIAVVNTWQPFVRGGAEHLAEALTAKLMEYGHEAVLLKIPFEWVPSSKIVDHIFACRSLHLAQVDRMIGLKFPSYYVPHSDKVLWLLHQFRQAYDLWGTQYQGLSNSHEGERVRRLIQESDNTILPEFRRIYTNSVVTSDRLRKFNGLSSEVLFPPLSNPESFYCSEYGDYIFCPGRINACKRQYLLIEAMCHVKSGVRLVIAGLPETPEDLSRLQRTIASNDLGSRVEVIPRFITEREKADLFADALACAYVPYDEDSYGYVSLEAFCSKKAVVTFSDSGGVLTLVEDGSTGKVCDPLPEACAAVFDELWLTRIQAKSLGHAGFEKMKSLNITWDRVVGALTS